MSDPRDPATPLTWATLATMTAADHHERERRQEALTPEEFEQLHDAIDARGIATIVDEISAWIRALADHARGRRVEIPLDPPLSAYRIAAWRRAIASLTDPPAPPVRPALAEHYVRELLRYDLGLRRRWAEPSMALRQWDHDAGGGLDILYAQTTHTSRQLADAADQPYPRPRSRRRRTRGL